MDTNKIEIIKGLDDITDYAVNFKEGKEPFYKALNKITETARIMYLFDLKNDKVSFLSNTSNEKGEVGFILFVGKSYSHILNYFKDVFTTLMLNGDLKKEDKQKQMKAITILSAGLCSLLGMDVEEALNKYLNEN